MYEVQSGRIVAPPGALKVLRNNGVSARRFVRRHIGGDWDDVSEEDKNKFAVGRPLRFFSVYHLKDGTNIWVITEGDRSSTCILLPSKY
jgi:hypothetical protein